MCYSHRHQNLTLSGSHMSGTTPRLRYCTELTTVVSHMQLAWSAKNCGRRGRVGLRLQPPGAAQPMTDRRLVPESGILELRQFALFVAPATVVGHVVAQLRPGASPEPPHSRHVWGQS